MNQLRFFIMFINLINCISMYSSADLVIFSYNRPMQLYALLESVEHYMTNVNQTLVVYRASDDSFEQGYQEVKKRFPSATYYQQGSNPYADFKQLTMRAIHESSSEYILFAVDDIIVTQPVDLAVCTESLETTGAYGFYLRLGKNINKCYMFHDMHTPVPQCISIAPNIYQFTFNQSTGDWAYPNTVDMTIYRKHAIKKVFEGLDFHNPNTLEGQWAGLADSSVCGLCFERSVMVNTPLNIVNENWSNRAENNYTPQALLAIFNDGFKIDIEPLYYILNQSPHMAYTPTFIKR